MADWEEIRKHLEPLTTHFYTTAYNDIQLSIAISLKRIADSLEKDKIRDEYKQGGFQG